MKSMKLASLNRESSIRISFKLKLSKINDNLMHYHTCIFINKINEESHVVLTIMQNKIWEKIISEYSGKLEIFLSTNKEFKIKKRKYSNSIFETVFGIRYSLSK